MNKNSTLGSYNRLAEHSNTWYSGSRADLTAELKKYLSRAKAGVEGRICGVISPHAGLAYSGPTAAWCYQYLTSALQRGNIKRVFVLHPSHHEYLPGAALSGARELETPLGPLQVDLDIMNELYATQLFDITTKSVDEAEHSAEMQYPYLKYCMLEVGVEVPVVPIMIGATKPEVDEKFANLLTKYCADSANFFVISSDFCHWGSRFGYQPGADTAEPYRFIEEMDKEGMSIIEQKDCRQFYDYLQRTENTICGRHPICVYLRALPGDRRVKFVQYAQSSAARNRNDSSVSYASAVITC